MKFKSAIPFLILIFFSFFLIFYQFTNIPKYLSFDEVEFTKLALSLDGKSYTPYSTSATGHSTLYFYILLFSLKTFGISVFALRLPAAIFGILSVLMFYLIMKLVVSQQFFPFVITVILLTSRWFLNFSRFAFEPTFLLFLELTSIYFLLKAAVILGRNEATTPESANNDSGRAPSSLARMTYLSFSGLFAGLAFNSYTPGRIFFLLPLGFLIFKLVNSLTRKQYNNITIKQLLYFIIPFLIIIAPLTIYLTTTKDSRIDQLFFWRNHEMTINQKIQGTIQNFSSLTLMFFTKGDMNGRHNYPGKPALNPIMAGLFLIGIFYSFKNFKDKHNQLFISYFILSLIPSIPIYPWENPSMLRTFTVIPSVIYFVGQGFSVIDSPKFLRLPRSLWSLAMTLVIIFSSFYELRTYFKYQKAVFESSFEIKYPLQKAIKLKNPYEKNQ